MTDTLMIQEVDCITGKEVIRPATAEEIASMEVLRVANEERLAAEEAKAAKKASVLSAIAEATGLTAEDISEALA